MSTQEKPLMVLALESWQAIKSERMPETAGSLSPSLDPDRLLLEIEAVTSVLSPYGIHGLHAMHVVGHMAKAMGEGIGSIDACTVFATGWIDGVGFGATHEHLRRQGISVELRAKLLEAEERRDELAGEAATLLEQLDGAKRELGRAPYATGDGGGEGPAYASSRPVVEAVEGGRSRPAAFDRRHRMIGFTVPARHWPAGCDDEVHTDALVTWDVDEPEPTLDLRFRRDGEDGQAIVNVKWSDIVEVFHRLAAQRQSIAQSEEAGDA